MKQRIMKKLGFKTINIPFYTFYSFNPEQRVEFIKTILEEYSLKIKNNKLQNEKINSIKQ
jgi:hypothetical protein